MWIGTVVMLWPYEWKVMSSNLGSQEFTFIFANFSLEWMWKGGGKPRRRGKSKGAEKPLNNYPWIGIKPTKPIFVLFLNPQWRHI